MIKAIIFDCFGVLTSDKWKKFVSTLPDNLRKPAREANHAHDSGLISKAEFINQVQKLTGCNPKTLEAIVAGDDLVQNKELLNYISQLKAEYKIGLLSNVASNWIREELLTSDEQALFDDMVFSFETGMTKPDSRIFEMTAKRLNVKPNECVFVDDVESYCIAAADTGMKAIVYKDFEQMKRELEKILS